MNSTINFKKSISKEKLIHFISSSETGIWHLSYAEYISICICNHEKNSKFHYPLAWEKSCWMLFTKPVDEKFLAIVNVNL